MSGLSYTFRMPTFLTPGRHGYSVRFSRTNPDTLAVATSQYYGLAGGGTLFFLELTQDGSSLVELQKIEWSDGLFDVSWSGCTEGLAACGAGDGGVLVCRPGCSAPLRVLRGHRGEVCSVDWPGRQVLSASWDTTVKLWDPESDSCVSTFSGHSQLVYSASFSPHSPSTFASVSGDGHLKLWSCSEQRPIAVIKAHDAEVLSCDWSGAESRLLASAGSDGLVRGWDLRSLAAPVFTLRGCERAVRRVQFCPHAPAVLAAVSYDFTTRIWDLKLGWSPLETIRHRSEFTFGLDWSSLRPRSLADCGWDSLVHVFVPRTLM
ncbi:unnamed protein product [Danaus chrysippus]|uniref:Peroxin-7 n=1 Tax=Danaus chrysippus TaxID=151541 RepID=A0A8J2VQG5_9NEOP|nr:unnamed protein product [Danaus chrysippus]